ncbi:MAG: alpha/beta fold hydrolase [Ktedonobacteraceae bacterium]|nr:alpha/beta fold hydrolase [Ktedonobacteraceae bacterium]
MQKVQLCLRTGVKLLLGVVLGALLVVMRYILRTPQPLASRLPGEAHLYRWKHGHIFYKVLGDEQAPPLVLLHAPGIGASSDEMRNLVGELAQRYRLYAPDLPGYGLSDRLALDYSADTYVAFCRDFLTEVVQRPAVLLASCLSCNYSIAVAACTPELCKRLVLLSPASLFRPSHSPLWLALLAANPLTGFVLYALLTMRPVLHALLVREYGRVSDDELDYRSAAAHQLGAHRAVLAQFSGRLNLDVSQYLAAVQQPVQFIWGERAWLITPARSRLPLHTQTALIADAGSLAHEERAGQVVAAMDRQQEAPPVALPPDASQSREEERAPPAAATVLPRDEETAETQEAETEEPDEQIALQAQVEAYCVKCRQKRLMENAHRIVTKNGRNAMEGVCPVCGTKLFRFVTG